ncbi:MAG: carbohydrate kinase [Oscillospiraceae bacterium]|nr:carbohydrate kinase [Oscillospiraceae bacterium]MBQ8731964.1 carbohydrate kinase [Oscillospiraceae bacterium]
MALGGLDLGTSGCKCTVMSADGSQLSCVYREYAAMRSDSAHELSCEVVLSAAKDVIRQAAAEAGEELQALCVTSFGESCALLDEEDRPLFPFMLYTDPRGGEETEELKALMDERQIFELCGHRPNPMYFLPKLLWIRKHHPEKYEKIKRVLPVGAYIVYMLCGRGITDYSLAARTMLLDVHKLCWCKELLEKTGLSDHYLPELGDAGTVAGEVLPRVAEELGLPKDMKLVVGCQDQIAAVIGSGTLKPNTATLGSGTVECLTPIFDRIPDHPALYDGGYSIVPAVGGLYVTYAFIFTGGALLQWYRDTFGESYVARGKEEGKSPYALMDREVGEDPTGLLVLPHFAGSATLNMDPDSKGCIYGAALSTKRSDLYRALMEGICYEMRMNMDALAEAGISFEVLRAAGGGARSAVWNQIRADILNKKLETIDTAEVGSMATCMLGGVACGVFANLEEAARLVQVKATIRPSQKSEAYQPHMARYRKLYTALKAVR